VAKVAQEEVVEPKIQNPQPEEKPLGETLKISSPNRCCRR
jgi:translocation and assembly module TamB